MKIILSIGTISNSIKGENKLEGSSRYMVLTKRIDLILKNNNVLDLIQGKLKKPTYESSEVEKENFREVEILDMNLIVDGVEDNLIPYISNINFT